MTSRLTSYFFGTALAVSAAAWSLPSHAATWQFSQGGFDGGAQVSGSFSAEDGDHDGWILGYEVTDFSFSFSGNAAVGAFTSSFGTGGGFMNLAYRVGSAAFEQSPYGGLVVIGETGGAQDDSIHLVMYVSFSDAWDAAHEPGLLTDALAGTTTRTNDWLHVSAVPEPQTWVLMLAGLGGIGAFVRRRND